MRRVAETVAWRWSLRLPGEVGHWLEKLPRLLGGKGAIAEDKKCGVVEFMIRMVEDYLVAQVFLELAEQSGCEMRLVVEAL